MSFERVVTLGVISSTLFGGPVTLTHADLPPLLVLEDGSPVRTVDDWQRRRAEIQDLMIDTFVGTFPTEVPEITEVDIRDEEVEDDGSTRRRIRLTFATPNRASFEIRVWTPNGEGPFPLLLTAPREYQIGWGEAALARGYMVCLYPGVDKHHQERDFPGYDSVWEDFRAEYPGATWTEISCKGWLAGRALDYLLDPAYGHDVAPDQIGIIGHSRYGKQSMIAAAFDERITAVVARSPGSPASCAYRLTSRHTFNEAPPDFPSPWFLESLKTYIGREDELPIDAHAWAALVAPRHLLIHTAHQDGCEPTWAVERGYLAGKEVYRLLGQSDNYHLAYRSGSHNPITDEHRQQNMDWFDLAFGRGTTTPNDFSETLIHRFDWDAWKRRQTAADLKPPSQAADPEVRIRWALGDSPESTNRDFDAPYISDEDSLRMDHDRWATDDTARMPVVFGDGVRGNVYYNASNTEPAPAVIWLHPYSYSTGYNEAYGVEGTTIYHRLAEAGYVVLAFDQSGFGLRLLECRDFYDTHPKWSRLGRMVSDVQAGVDFLSDGFGKAEGAMPAVLAKKVYLVGYSMGGMVGLYATALDQRIAGVASFSGFTPMRADIDESTTGGLQRLWSDHALLPKLGLFDGRESDLPYDYDDVIGLVAPRPCLIVSPQRDREADFDDVVACVNHVRKAWAAQGRSDALIHRTPDDFNRFQRVQQDEVLAWLTRFTEE